jgi:membrane protein implicated in regulation of membrane protease activity
MSDELELWQSQSAESTPLTAARLAEMEKKMRRTRYDFYAAIIGIAIVIVGIAVLFPNVTLTIGAVLTLCGFGYLAYEVIASHRGTPSPADVSIDYQRALMRHRIEFHRKRLWLRVAALTPGGVLVFLGFAAVLPKLSMFIYLQLATFLMAIALMVPLNRRAAFRLQQQVDELDRLQ